MAERSIPVILVVSYSSPISIAQMPVPVPISKTFFGGFVSVNGAKCSLPPIKCLMMTYW